ncbi:MAG: extracellular solute-binding protein [bacterium]|nr:extracellular solute-binding protein [bacterium]
MRPFQIILLAVFVIAAIGGLVAFSLFKGNSGPNGGPAVLEIWGSFPAQAFSAATADLSGDEFNLTYTEIRADKFEQAFIEALAAGRGPDAIILPSDLVVRHSDKIVPIPLDTLSERRFKDSFVEATEVFLSTTGTIAVPLAVDPLVAYWNRDRFGAAGIARPPRYWDEVLTLVPKLTLRNRLGQIQISGVSLGEYRNITNAKEILAALFFQSGGKLVSRTIEGGFGVSLDDFANAGSALGFFTEFANPVKKLYTWNRGLPPSRDMFASGDLALYFGFASEYAGLREKNPHLNMSATPFPQTRDSKLVVSFGKAWGIAALKTSKNPAGAMRLGFALADSARAQKLAEALGTVPPLRALLERKQESAAKSVFYEAALQARGFLDPNPTETTKLFQAVVEDITGGRGQLTSGVGDLRSGLERLLR